MTGPRGSPAACGLIEIVPAESSTSSWFTLATVQSAHDYVGNRWHKPFRLIAPPLGKTRYSPIDRTHALAAAASGEFEEDPADEQDEPLPARGMRQPLPACRSREQLR
jgi:hypothetical protein